VQRQTLLVFATLCVLFPSVYAQTESPAPAPTPVPRMKGAAKQASIAAAAGNSGATANTSAVPMDQPVITLKGGCQPEGDIAPAKDCVSSVTRAEFEKLTNALQPDMAADSKRQFATNYSRLLVFSDAARALHLENDPNVQQIIHFVTNQVLAEGLKRHYTEQYAHPTDAQIQDYYNKNSAKYREATLERIIIPNNPGTADKPEDNKAQAAATAEKIRQRWVAGEDAVKLQQAAFESAGVTGASTPEINIGAKRPGSLPVNQEGVFQLKAGEISQAYSDPAATYLYKAVTVREIPLSEVKDSIVKTLQQQQLQDKLEAVGKSATPVLNDEYFGPAPAANPAAPAGRPGAMGAPQSGNPPK
jgi:PPIC-type PPIASE domain